MINKDLHPNPVLSDPWIHMTFKVKNCYQNFFRRSYKVLDTLVVLQLFDPVDHQNNPEF